MQVKVKKMNRIIALFLTAVAALIMLNACASVGPDYTVPEITTPGNWHAPTAANISTNEESQALSTWWNNLGDSQLTGLIERSVANNLNLKQAWARVKQAKAKRGAAKAGRTPSLSAAASGTSTRTALGTGDSLGQESYGLELDASWELDLFGGTRRSIEAAQADLEASQEALRDVLVSLTAEVATNYVQMRTYQKRLALAEGNLKIQAETLELTAMRYETGLATALDTEQARTNLESTRGPDSHSAIQPGRNK